MGPLVKANLLMSLDAYSNRYHWKKRYSAGILRMNRFSSDAKHFGTGHLYGLPMTGEVVGVYYNKAKLRTLGIAVPTTFAAFQAALAKAKDGGEIPIQFGNLDKWPGIHEYEELMLQNVSRGYARSFIFGSNNGKTSFKSAGTTSAAAKLQAWGKAGFFTDGYSGVGYDPSWKSFGKGKGVFQISGSWLTADLKKSLGKDVGFFLLPPPKGRALSTLGGEGLPWAISTKSKNADAAATYLDYITNAKSQQVAANNGQLTATKAKVRVPSGFDTEVAKQWIRANAKDAIVPYLDWATPTMYDTSTAKIQELLASKTSPSDFVAAIQSDYAKFHHG